MPARRALRHAVFILLVAAILRCRRRFSPLLLAAAISYYAFTMAYCCLRLAAIATLRRH